MINIVYCSNNNYAPYVGVSMISFLENNHTEFNKINIHIIDSEISEDYKNKLKKIVEPYKNSNIEFHKFNINDYGCTPKKCNFPDITFASLFLHTLLDENIDKVLYLDADSIITGSFKNLIENTEFSNDKLIAAALDVPLKCERNKLKLKHPDYFNTGLLLLDLNRIRYLNIDEEIINTVNNTYLRFADQDAYNIIYNGKILKISPKYNLFGYFHEFDYKNVMKCFSLEHDEYYTEEEIIEAKENPIFNHFINLFHVNPWDDSTNPLFELYEHYGNKTPFEKESLYHSKPKPLIKRILFKLRFILPDSIFSKISSYYIKHFVDNCSE